MFEKNYKPIKSITGSKISYVNKKKRPSVQMKIEWKNNIYTWEDKENLSDYSIKLYENYLLKNIRKFDDILLHKNVKTNYLLLPYIVDLQQRNCLHYAPLSKDLTLSTKLIFTGIAADFPDFEGRTPLDLSINYNKISILKLILSCLNSLNLDILNSFKISYLLKNKTNKITTGNEMLQNIENIDVIRIIKIIISWLFVVSNDYLQTAILRKNLQKSILIYEKQSFSYKWISHHLIDTEKYKEIKKNILVQPNKAIISKRKLNELIQMLVKIKDKSSSFSIIKWQNLSEDIKNSRYNDQNIRKLYIINSLL